MISHSDSISKVMAAILAVQKDVDHVEKTATNPHFGNTYAELNTFLRTLRGPLADHGLTMTQAPGMENGHVTVDTLLHHESGEWIRNRASAPMQKNDPQGVGSAITYLRRYSLAALFAVPQEDDDGNAASGRRSVSGRSGGRKANGADAEYHCPKCGEAMWDNRADKEARKVKPNYPDFKCRNKGCDHAIWGTHPQDAEKGGEGGGEVPPELVAKVRGLLDVGAQQNAIDDKQAARIEEALQSGDVGRAESALEWLRERVVPANAPNESAPV